MLSARVDHYLRHGRIDAVMQHLARLTELDRYQASLGIERAAELIAHAAEALGLADVTIERFTADGATPWWTFQAPRAWTPTTARLELAGLTFDHATQPFTIATYSAPASATLRVAHDTADVEGALVVIDDLAAIPTLAARGAAGFITAAPARAGQPGRVELDARTPLFGFSITPVQRHAIAAAHEARVHVEIDRSARMPVVTARLPGRGPGEVWLTSHLCHPRPGANDNASGAAGLLGVAAALHRDLARSVRFVWGPEFLGVAALLHQRHRDPAARPVAVINLDMIGEDPRQCRIPLVVERPPDWCTSLLAPLAEHIADETFAQTGTHPGTWRPGPFHGFSDHALFATFADPRSRSPAVQLWHPGDPFNHSAADTIDKVSPTQLRRAITIGATLAEVCANGTTDASLATCIARWCERDSADADATADRHRDHDGGAWSRRFAAHAHAQRDLVRSLVDGDATAMRPPPPDRRAFAARWPGPFNYRGVLAALSPAHRDDMLALFAADKRNYAVLTHLALLAPTCTTREEAIDAASLALRAPIEPSAATALWSALLEAHWIGDA